MLVENVTQIGLPPLTETTEMQLNSFRFFVQFLIAPEVNDLLGIFLLLFPMKVRPSDYLLMLNDIYWWCTPRQM